MCSWSWHDFSLLFLVLQLLLWSSKPLHNKKHLEIAIPANLLNIISFLCVFCSFQALSWSRHFSLFLQLLDVATRAARRVSHDLHNRRARWGARYGGIATPSQDPCRRQTGTAPQPKAAGAGVSPQLRRNETGRATATLKGRREERQCLEPQAICSGHLMLRTHQQQTKQLMNS